MVLAAKSLPKIQPFGGRFQKRRFSENPYKTLAVRTKIEVQILKKLKKIVKKSIPRYPQNKYRNKHSKNWFGDPFWDPKPLQNRGRILLKNMLKKEAKKSRNLEAGPGAPWEVYPSPAHLQVGVLEAIY